MRIIDLNLRMAKQIFVGSVVLAFFVVAFLTAELVGEMQKLRSASVDNVEWNINQLEIEVLKLQRAVKRQLASNTKSKDDIRLRFDIFYSRVSIISDGSMSNLIVQSGHSEELSQIRLFAENTAAIMDGPSEVFLQSLPSIDEQLSIQSETARRVSLGLLSSLVVQSDIVRENLSGLFGTIAIAVSCVFGAFWASLYLVLRLHGLAVANGLQMEFFAAKLQATIDATQDAVLILDQSGLILETGGAFGELFKISKSEIQRVPLRNILIDYDQKLFSFDENALVTQDRNTTPHFTFLKGTARRHDGSQFPVEYSFQPVKIGQESYFVMFVSDVTEQEKNELKLLDARTKAEAAAQEKSRFIGVVSHEMRTPLYGILGSLEMLKGENLSNQELKFLRTAKRSSTRLAKLVENVLSVSSLDSQLKTTNSKTFSVNGLLDKLGEDFQFEAAKNGNKIEVSVAQTASRCVFADVDILHHILGNFVSNALKFSEGGLVKISASLNESTIRPNALTLVVSVEDNGCGISRENLDRIFEDFVSITTPNGKHISGTGLGLGIAQRLANLVGGWIDVNSTLDVGSVFSINYPVNKPVEASVGIKKADSTVAIKHNSSPSFNVLIAEDDEVSRTVLEAQLKSLGHTPTLAEDGVECCLLAKTKCFDVILMDFAMPNMDGLNAAKHIRTAGMSKNTPIIGISADKSSIARNKALDSGINFLLAKPLKRDSLQEKLTVISELVEPGGLVSLLDKAVISDIKKYQGVGKSKRVVGSFIYRTERLFASTCRQTWVDSPIEFAAAAHKSAGAAAMLGANRLAELLLQLEERAHTAPAAFPSEAEYEKLLCLVLITKGQLELEYDIQNESA